jgi:hypothetical protein
MPKSSKPKRILHQTVRAQDQAEQTILQRAEAERLIGNHNVSRATDFYTRRIKKQLSTAEHKG